jgi:hypothetical protein
MLPMCLPHSPPVDAAKVVRTIGDVFNTIAPEAAVGGSQSKHTNASTRFAAAMNETTVLQAARAFRY